MTPPHLELARCKGPQKTKSKRSKKLEKSEKLPKKHEKSDKNIEKSQKRWKAMHGGTGVGGTWICRLF